MKRIRAIALLVGLTSILAVPQGASARYQDVIRDCHQDGKLDGRYSQKDLRNAKNHLPSDVNEYGPCADLIAAALRNGGGGSSLNPRAGTSSGVPTSSGAIAQTREDVADLRNAADEAQRQGEAPVATAAGTLRPTAGRLDEVPGAANDLPGPLLVAIAAVTALCLLGGIVAGRRRFGALVRGPLRLVRR